MPISFSKPGARFQKGELFLGMYGNEEVGIATERHAITIAGAGAGKGATLIIPNLRRWAQSVLVVDPKGENAEQTWQARANMGQSVHVLDPFHSAKIPKRMRATYNPLATINPYSLTAREDIKVIADGMVMRYKADDGMWDNGTVSLIAGVIAHVVSKCPPERRDLVEVRRLLRQSDAMLEVLFQDMEKNPACGGLAQAAAAVGLSTAKSSQEFVKAARDNTEWLDSPAMAAMLKSSSFKLSDLKGGAASVFLVLPPQYLGEHARFLRLFVRAALNEMAKKESGTGRCLFLLDEFFSLGKIDEIAKAAGLMRSYGVQLWPFLQDVGQLHTLYGQQGLETFFGNSDAHVFFGNTDDLTLEYISRKLGTVTREEIKVSAPTTQAVTPLIIPWKSNGKWGVTDFGLTNPMREAEQARFANESAAYQDAMSQLGRPRLTPTEVRELVGKKDGASVARSMLVFGKGGDVFNLRPRPHWDEPRPETELEKAERLGQPDITTISHLTASGVQLRTVSRRKRISDLLAVIIFVVAFAVTINVVDGAIRLLNLVTRDGLANALRDGQPLIQYSARIILGLAGIIGCILFSRSARSFRANLNAQISSLRQKIPAEIAAAVASENVNRAAWRARAQQLRNAPAKKEEY